MAQDGGQAYRFWPRWVKIKLKQKINLDPSLHDIAWIAMPNHYARCGQTQRLFTLSENEF
jgi:hypothetical protein